MTGPRQRPNDSVGEVEATAARRIDRVTDWLYVGGALPPADYGRLREARITHVVDLREDSDADSERLRALGIAPNHVPVPDQGHPTTEQLAEVSACLTEADESATVYVHCKSGFGRAAVTAAGLLVVRGASPDEAVDQVRTACPETRLNGAQLAWLRSLDQR